MEINQYDVLLVNLEPTLGHEIRKTRPCVVISPDEMNRHLQTIVVAPMTTSLTNYPTRVKIVFRKKTGRIALDQIRTLHRIRVIKKLGHVTASEIKNIKLTIVKMFVE